MAAAVENIVKNPKSMAKGTEAAAPKTDATLFMPIAIGIKLTSFELTICIPLGKGIPIANPSGDKNNPIRTIFNDVLWGSNILNISSM